MSSNDLFSFLDEAPPEGDDIENGDAMEVEEKAEVFVPLHKRKADGISVALDSNNGQELEEQNDLPPSSKKPRLSSPKPVVLDDFETEAKREVDASAGLQGSAEPGTRLEIRHQVRVSFGWLISLVLIHHQVRHQVAVPPGYSYIPISKHVPPAKPDREYKFELDPFQRVSVYAIQRNESVLVSAHTSAGKTVVAEYAIAQCLNRKQRVIYTSPIKVLICSSIRPRDWFTLGFLGTEQPEIP